MPRQKPENKENDKSNFFGTSVVGTKGQIVIPKSARDEYDLKPGDQILVFGGQQKVLALMKSDEIDTFLGKLASSIK